MGQLKLGLAVAMLLGASPLDERIAQAMESHKGLARATWGMHVISLATGEVVYAFNEDKLFVPASNTKLYSTALALARLGPDHRFHTRARVAAPPDGEGRIAGDLILEGGGDATLGAREVPYHRQSKPGDPLRQIREIADSIVARGVKRIDGDIVGDDTRYIREPYPAGWANDDALWEYGAPVSALTVNDNAIKLRLTPGEPGEPAVVEFEPALEFYFVDNRVVTVPVGPAGVDIDRETGSRQIRLTGSLRQARTELLAIDDPAEFAAVALYQMLQERGVTIRGRAAGRHRFPGEDRPDLPAYVLAERASPPLIETLRVINKVSQNLQAELVLREVAFAARGTGSRADGLEELRKFLAEIGIAEDSYRFRDASGLSRLTLTTPANTTRLLAYMAQTVHREAWAGTLPAAGEDGTLDKRFRGVLPGQIRAKTGTMTGVNALGGYAESPRYGPVAFCIMVNNSAVRNEEVRQFIDKIGLALLE
ncbi:MAG: D-alanyl-D-alanine carboxypeptidase/D-alanyl-D-alanine-endopeptidase [Bryobacteraceae bacterium]|nr:D-alanyl-D-alanine carboxypeptidase/D-alanyl-D-alanine-endopeptidase [Bryobacteraceae bacterium]